MSLKGPADDLSEGPEAMGGINPPSGRSSKQRNLLLMMVSLLFASFIMMFLATFIGVVISVIYHPYSSIHSIPIILSVSMTLFMVLSQVVTHIYHGRAVLPLYLIASYLIAVFFYAFLISVVMSPVLLAMLFSGVEFHDSFLALPVRISIPLLMISILVWGTLNARYLRTRRAKLDVLYGGKRKVKIALISDLHLGLMVGKNRLDAISRRLEKESPDLIISSGDLVDTRPRFLKRFEPFVRRMVNIAPVYAVCGNHEFYNGQDLSIQWMSKLGINVLDNEMITDERTGLQLAGVHDPSSFDSILTHRKTVTDLLASHKGKEHLILVNHQPVHFRYASKKRNIIQLSGHTHAGQIWPFSLATRTVFREGYRGLYKYGGSFMYVCTGTGTWGPPMRIGTESQMVMLELE